MTLVIDALKNPGDLNSERLVLRVSESCNAGDYVVVRALEDGGLPLSGPVDALWIPDQDVEEGDIVIIYTKVGSKKNKKNSAGKVSYFFYWGKSHINWGRGYIPCLLYSPSFEYLDATKTRGGDDWEPDAE